MKLEHLLVALALAAGCGGNGADGNGPYCGDGVQQAGEQCDDGTSNGLPGDPCSATCAMAKTGCGDGVIETGEECDDGARNGAPPAACSATCTFNDPTLTVHWQITALDGTVGACPGWPASAQDPQPSSSSIRLIAVSPDSTTSCQGPDFGACAVATFDCADGEGSVRLRPGSYSVFLQPVQATDVYAPTQQAHIMLTSSQDITFGSNGGLHQGTQLSVSWTGSPDPMCQSLQVVATSTDDLGHASSWQSKTEPCGSGTALLGPYLPGAYTVAVTQQPSGTVTQLTNPVQIERSNMDPIQADTITVLGP